MVSDTYTFSIEKGNNDLINELQEAALSGERVNLLYKERYMSVPWRGDTKVFAVGIERATNPQSNEKKDDTFPRR